MLKLKPNMFFVYFSAFINKTLRNALEAANISPDDLSKVFYVKNKMFSQPGPARSEVEHLLCKIVFSGDAKSFLHTNFCIKHDLDSSKYVT